MFVKLSALLFHVLIISILGEKLDWDFAVVVENEVLLLSSNGSEIDKRSQPFSSLKALVYDGVRDQFIVSDTDQENDTIYTVRFTKETKETVPIIRDLPGEVQGLAVDPVEDVLYWTDAINHTINYVSLNDSTFNSKEYKVFDDKVPHAIAIDVCNRYIYYTNPSSEKPTIERMKLDKSGHEILVSNTIMSPVGLAIDYQDQRLYWADSRIGTAAGRIESIAMDGTDRKLVIERNTMEPYGLTVTEDAIYWTDTNNNVLYKFLKTIDDPYTDPEKLVEFPSGTPMGLVSKNRFLQDDCRNLTAIVKEYQEHKDDADMATSLIEEKEVFRCLNDGKMVESRCVCKRGFTGDYCQFSLCSRDFCMKGQCYISKFGPVCNCDSGFVGPRCQKDLCDGYCLHDGECMISSIKNSPKCSCPEGFIGNRCEYNKNICDLYCNDIPNSQLSREFELMCRCNNLHLEKNASSALQSSVSVSVETDILTKLQDPVIYLSCFLLCCLLIILALLVYIRQIQKRRPRIKKRIIVNKNVTPLTYRPQPNTEQCEITIENCCNMNICETPCFEPTGEDKKKLLTNMEGEDLY